MTKDEALKLALEALEDLGMKHYESTGEVLYKETSTAIKEALAQPSVSVEQEPVAWMYEVNNAHTCLDLFEPPDDAYDEGTLYPLYTAPSQRTWVNATTWRGLTDEEVKDIVWNLPYEPSQEHIRAIEAKLKEKNT